MKHNQVTTISELEVGSFFRFIGDAGEMSELFIKASEAPYNRSTRLVDGFTTLNKNDEKVIRANVSFTEDEPKIKTASHLDLKFGTWYMSNCGRYVCMSGREPGRPCAIITLCEYFMALSNQGPAIPDDGDFRIVREFNIETGHWEFDYE